MEEETYRNWLDKVQELEKGDSAQKAVAAIARDIQDRRGIGNEIEGMDYDIVSEMLDGWVERIREAG
jgi:hypothetical protein